MVKDRTVKALEDARKTSGRPPVPIAGPRVAAGMIVCKQETRTVMLKRIRNDFLQRKRGAMIIAILPREVEATFVRVYVGYPKRFVLGASKGEPLLEELSCGVQIS